MTAPFPHRYVATVRRRRPGRAVVDATNRPVIEGGAPPEFGGSDEVWSPEHLLLGAIGLCLETTFEALAARDHLAVDEWQVTVDGTVDRTVAGLAFTAVSSTIHITVAPELIERTHAVAARAKHCLIASSLRIPVDVAVVVIASDAGRARSPAPWASTAAGHQRGRD